MVLSRVVDKSSPFDKVSLAAGGVLFGQEALRATEGPRVRVSGAQHLLKMQAAQGQRRPLLARLGQQGVGPRLLGHPRHSRVLLKMRVQLVPACGGLAALRVGGSGLRTRVAAVMQHRGMLLAATNLQCQMQLCLSTEQAPKHRNRLLVQLPKHPPSHFQSRK